MNLDDCLASVRVEVAHVLAVEHIGGDHDEVDLFEIGLDSLCAVELLARLRDKEGIQISVTTIFENPTIRNLAERVYESKHPVR